MIKKMYINSQFGTEWLRLHSCTQNFKLQFELWNNCFKRYRDAYIYTIVMCKHILITQHLEPFNKNWNDKIRSDHQKLLVQCRFQEEYRRTLFENNCIGFLGKQETFSSINALFKLHILHITCNCCHPNCLVNKTFQPNSVVMILYCISFK